ncbi:DUF2190 family protein [Rhizobium tumorigenes]|uniref:DUF2190 family protein n=1 Tax=Rhizobium tumorigenes TaxID=2041385 RepID=UPI00241C5B85|nr:DUF2190 family protein [Rhizobium tumorigenes]WFS01598.1 DUF2190 family protein [Rhizobium tumorigenes]
MKNFLQPGHSIDVPAPTGGSVSGMPVIIGSLIGIASVTALAGTLIAIQRTGCYSLPKAAQALTLGAKVYWDATNKVITTTSASNTLIGTAIADAASGDATGNVLLGPTTV